MTGYSNPIPDGYEPLEIIVRHPDFEDDVYNYGLTHRCIYLDLGSSFDITRGVDRETAEEWIDGVREQIANLPADHPAREKVEEVIRDVLEAIVP